MGDRARRDRYLAVVLIVPLVLVLVVFLVIPTVTVVVRASAIGSGFFATAFGHVLTEPHRAGVADAFRVAIVSSLLGTAAALAISNMLCALRRPQRLRSALDAWTAAACRLGGAPLAVVFVVALGLQTMLTRALVHVAAATEFLALAEFWWVVAVYLVFQVPLALTVILPAVAGLPVRWRDTAASLGIATAAYRRRVAIPIVVPATLGGALVLFVNAITAYTSAFVLRGEGDHAPLHAAPLHALSPTVTDGDLAIGLAAWMIAILLLSLLVAMVLVRRTLRWVAPCP